MFRVCFKPSSFKLVEESEYSVKLDKKSGDVGEFENTPKEESGEEEASTSFRA